MPIWQTKHRKIWNCWFTISETASVHWLSTDYNKFSMTQKWIRRQKKLAWNISTPIYFLRLSLAGQITNIQGRLLSTTCCWATITSITVHYPLYNLIVKGCPFKSMEEGCIWKGHSTRWPWVAVISILSLASAIAATHLPSYSLYFQTLTPFRLVSSCLFSLYLLLYPKQFYP